MAFVAKDKQSKKEKAKAEKTRRKLWGFSPVTRVKQSRKVYRRTPKHKGKERKAHDPLY